MKRHHESGYILVGTLLAIVLLAVVGMSLTSLATFSIKTSSAERDNQSVYYIAEAGLNDLVNKIEVESENIHKVHHINTKEDFYNKLEQFDFFAERYDSFEKVNEIQPYALLSIEKLSEQGTYRLISTGHLAGESRTVSQVIKVEWYEKNPEKSIEEYELPPFAVFTDGTFLMKNGKIIGDIGTTSTKKGAIKFQGGNSKLDGDIYVPAGESYIVENGSKYTIKTLNPSYSVPKLPEFPDIPKDQCSSNGELSIKNTKYTLDMTDNMYFKEIKLNSNKSLLTIDVKDKDRELVVDDLNIGNGKIELKGSGSLTIFVTGEITLKGHGSINENGYISKLNIFLSGTGNKNNRKQIDLTGGQKIYGSLYAEDADIKGAGGGGIYGNIFTGGNEIVLTGNSKINTQLVLAPNAKVEMKGGGELKGMIIANKFEITGNGRVFLDEPFVIDGPISPATLVGYKDHESERKDESERIETGKKPQIYKSKVREIKAINQ